MESVRKNWHTDHKACTEYLAQVHRKSIDKLLKKNIYGNPKIEASFWRSSAEWATMWQEIKTMPVEKLILNRIPDPNSGYELVR